MLLRPLELRTRSQKEVLWRGGRGLLELLSVRGSSDCEVRIRENLSDGRGKVKMGKKGGAR